MGKNFYILFFFLLPINSYADGSQLAVGVGLPYGGLGVKYSVDIGGRIYGGVGLLAYSSNGSDIGYTLGYENNLLNDRHVIGVSVGKVRASQRHDEKYDYFGGALHYAYYLNGWENNSWHVGGALAYGKRDVPENYGDDKTEFVLTLGYQF